MYIDIYDSDGKFLKKLPAGNRKGINIVRLATSMAPPKVPKSPNILGEAAFGPDYLAGTYTLKLIKGTETYTTNLILNDIPDLKHSTEDRKLQRETLIKAYNMLEELAGVDQQILDTHDTLKSMTSTFKGSRLKNVQSLIASCEKMHGQISATQSGEGGITGQVRLRENIAEVYSAVGGYPGRPTNLQIKALENYGNQVKEFTTKIEMIKKSEIPKIIR
jgi:hypothetical protein